MANFNLTAKLVLRGPSSSNVTAIMAKLRKRLEKNTTIPINVNINKKSLNKAKKDLKGITKGLKNVNNATKQATSGIGAFAAQTGLALKRFAAFQIGAAATFGVFFGILSKFKGAVEFEAKMAKIAQVADVTLRSVDGLGNSIRDAAVDFGVSAGEIADSLLILKSAGFELNSLKGFAPILAKAKLAPTLGGLENVSNAIIILKEQFGLKTPKEFEQALSRINDVSSKFPVEAEGIVAALQKAGGAFATAGADVSELIAIFTAVRAATRESSDTLGVFLRNFAQRVFQQRNINKLRDILGVELVDDAGKIVTPMTALLRIIEGIKAQGPLGDQLQLASIRELLTQITGFRQGARFIATIAASETVVKAFNEAKKESNSLDSDTIIAQETLLNQWEQMQQNLDRLFDDALKKGRGFLGLLIRIANFALDSPSDTLQFFDPNNTQIRNAFARPSGSPEVPFGGLGGNPNLSLAEISRGINPVTFGAVSRRFNNKEDLDLETMRQFINQELERTGGQVSIDFIIRKFLSALQTQSLLDTEKGGNDRLSQNETTIQETINVLEQFNVAMQNFIGTFRRNVLGGINRDLIFAEETIKGPGDTFRSIGASLLENALSGFDVAFGGGVSGGGFVNTSIFDRAASATTARNILQKSLADVAGAAQAEGLLGSQLSEKVSEKISELFEAAGVSGDLSGLIQERITKIIEKDTGEIGLAERFGDLQKLMSELFPEFDSLISVAQDTAVALGKLQNALGDSEKRVGVAFRKLSDVALKTIDIKTQKDQLIQKFGGEIDLSGDFRSRFITEIRKRSGTVGGANNLVPDLDFKLIDLRSQLVTTPETDAAERQRLSEEILSTQSALKLFADSTKEATLLRGELNTLEKEQAAIQKRRDDRVGGAAGFFSADIKRQAEIARQAVAARRLVKQGFAASDTETRKGGIKFLQSSIAKSVDKVFGLDSAGNLLEKLLEDAGLPLPDLADVEGRIKTKEEELLNRISERVKAQESLLALEKQEFEIELRRRELAENNLNRGKKVISEAEAPPIAQPIKPRVDQGGEGSTGNNNGNPDATDISITGTHDVNVQIVGAAVFQEIIPGIQDLIVSQINTAMRATFNQDGTLRNIDSINNNVPIGGTA